MNDKLLLVAATLCIDYKMYTAPAQQKMKEGVHVGNSVKRLGDALSFIFVLGRGMIFVTRLLIIVLKGK